jgi:bacterioferritin
MKGNDKVLAALNDLLADELTAINQYMVHSEMCENWGYDILHGAIEKRAIQEMKHAEKLISRILFLEGLPIVSKLNPIHIGDDVAKQLENDWQAEKGAIDNYNHFIVTAQEAQDNGSRDLFTSILNDEEVHLDWLEAQLDQIKQMGLQNYLSHQTKSPA